MVASSQGDEDDEERRALEQELAAELAALSAQDVGFDESLDEHDDQNDIGGCVGNGEIEMNYVSLDLDTVLKQVVNGAVDEVQDLHDHDSFEDEEHRVSPTSWELLLQSVERNDREFFQPCHENLHEIRASILDVQSPASQVQQPGEQAIEVEIHSHQPEKVDQLIFEFATQPEKSSLPLPIHVNEEQVNSQDNVDEQECSNAGTANSIPDVSAGLIERTTANDPPIVAELAHTDRSPTPQASDLPPQALPLSDVYYLTIITEENQPGDDQAAQKQLQMIAKQHEARESRRLQAQARYENERDKAAQLLLRLQEELEAQEKHTEITRREAQERSLMTNEEMRCRQYAAAEREADEIALMKIADEDSHKFAVELDRIQNAIRKEVAQMETEDQAGRHRMQVERQSQLQKQKALARRLFSAVLLELIKHHEIQRQIRDQQTKRERRECVEMRAEEAYIRRVLVETRAIHEKQERDRNRALMIREDELANAFEKRERMQKLHAEERLHEERCRGKMEEEETRSRSAWIFIEHLELMQNQNEEHFRLAMEQEEKRCTRAWIYLAELAEAEAKERERQHEIQRLRILSNISTGFQRLDRVFRRHELIKGFEKWKWWRQQCINEDWTRATVAAKRIQMWHRSYRQRLQQYISVEPLLVLENISDEEQPQIEKGEEDNDVEELDDEDYSCENQEAALRLQSTFRGFHVRRKFASALALAQTVEHEGGSFDAVDLDDLIQLPPELEDGWEDPVLPPTSIHSRRQHPSIPQQLDRDEEKFDHVDNNNLEDDGSLDRCKPVVKMNVARTPTTKEPPKEQNLAMQLWNKMKRAKNRQQQTQQERQRQQDPVYRVQKLLNRKPNIRNVSSQNGNSSNNQSSHTQGNQKVVNMVSWSSTSNAKKKPKVKLPSLVERLRKQTMAER